MHWMSLLIQINAMAHNLPQSGERASNTVKIAVAGLLLAIVLVAILLLRGKKNDDDQEPKV